LSCSFYLVSRFGKQVGGVDDHGHGGVPDPLEVKKIRGEHLRPEAGGQRPRHQHRAVQWAENRLAGHLDGDGLEG
jgi:hypothetical protein